MSGGCGKFFLAGFTLHSRFLRRSNACLQLLEFGLTRHQNGIRVRFGLAGIIRRFFLRSLILGGFRQRLLGLLLIFFLGGFLLLSRIEILFRQFDKSVGKISTKLRMLSHYIQLKIAVLLQNSLAVLKVPTA